MKTKPILWLGLAVLLAFTAGCPVDINEGGDDGDDGPSTAECMKAELATVRFVHAAGGTPVTRPDFGPATTRSLTIVRPDPEDAAEVVTVATMAPGRGAIVTLCGNKPLMLGARLAGADEDRVTLPIMFTPDTMPSALDAGTTIVVAGIADTLVDGVPENPASVANPLRFIVVPDTFSTGAETQIQVVHASRKTPTPVDVEANPDTAGPELLALARYGVSAVVSTKGTPDTAPISLPVVFMEGTATRVSFTIAPRMPTSAKALAILFDTEIFDPKNPAPPPAPVTRLFVTGDDPLLGGVAGGGVTF